MRLYRGHEKTRSPWETQTTAPSFTDSLAVAHFHAGLATPGIVSSFDFTLHNALQFGDDAGVTSFEELTKLKVPQEILAGLQWIEDAEERDFHEITPEGYVETFALANTPAFIAWTKAQGKTSIVYRAIFSEALDKTYPWGSYDGNFVMEVRPLILHP